MEQQVCSAYSLPGEQRKRVDRSRKRRMSPLFVYFKYWIR